MFVEGTQTTRPLLSCTKVYTCPGLEDNSLLRIQKDDTVGVYVSGLCVPDVQCPGVSVVVTRSQGRWRNREEKWSLEKC